MENRSEENGSANQESPQKRNSNSLLLLLAVSVLVAMLFLRGDTDRSEISESYFLTELDKGNIVEVQIGDSRVYGKFRVEPEVPTTKDKDGKLVQPKADDGTAKKYFEDFAYNRSNDDGEVRALKERLVAQDVRFENLSPDKTQAIISLIAFVGLPLALLAFLYFMMRRRSDMMGGGFLSGFSKSPAKRFEASDRMISFADVAGLDGVKADLQEIVDYLKTPDKFQKLGGHVPKGVLLNGPPGTGKNIVGSGGRWRSRRAVLFCQRQRVHTDVRRGRCEPSA